MKSVYRPADLEMLKIMGEIRDEMKAMRELMESHLGLQDEPDAPDNYDMSVEGVKSLLLKVCKQGSKFYPSELAVEHGLDYDTVLEAVASLKKEGRVEC